MNASHGLIYDTIGLPSGRWLLRQKCSCGHIYAEMAVALHGPLTLKEQVDVFTTMNAQNREAIRAHSLAPTAALDTAPRPEPASTAGQ